MKQEGSGFCRGPVQGLHTHWVVAGALRSSAWEPPSTSPHPAVRALNYVCEHLGLISTDFVHPLATCVLSIREA